MTSETKSRSVIKTIFAGLLVVVCLPLVMLVVLWLAYASSRVEARPPTREVPKQRMTESGRAQVAPSDAFRTAPSPSTGANGAFATTPVESQFAPDNQARDAFGGGYGRINQGASRDPFAEPGMNRAPRTTNQTYRTPTTNRTTEEAYSVQIPYQDAKTGETKFRTETRTIQRSVPVRAGSPVSNYGRQPIQSGGNTHSQVVMQLVGDLQRTVESDPNRDEKLSRLREELGVQFDSMHQIQAREIDDAKKRLESLQEIHDARTENKEKIVQRRINQLLGKWDELDWNPSPSPNRYGSIAGSPIGSGQLSNTPANPNGSRQPSRVPANQYANRPVIPPGTQATTRNQIRKWNEESADSEPSRRPAVAPESSFPISSQQPQVRRDSPHVQDFGRTGGRVAGDSMNKPSSRNAFLRSENSTSALFDLARKAAKAKSELRTLKEKLTQLQELHEQGVLPISELRQIEATHKQATEEVRLYDLERLAMEDSLKLQYSAARSELQNLQRQLRGLSTTNAKDPNALQQKASLAGLVAQTENAIRRSELFLQQMKVAFDTTDENESSKNESLEIDTSEPLTFESDTLKSEPLESAGSENPLAAEPSPLEDSKDTDSET